MPKLSTGTKELWAACYGHPSEDVICHIPEAVTGIEITTNHARDVNFDEKKRDNTDEESKRLQG